jgi:predicted dienelactone hydrolase
MRWAVIVGLGLALVACDDGESGDAATGGAGGGDADAALGGFSGSGATGGSSGSGGAGGGGGGGGGAAAGGAAGGGGAGGAPPDSLSWPIDAPGPFNTGFRGISTDYDFPTTDEDRTILVNVWYPTTDTEGDNPRYLGTRVDFEVFEGATVAPPVHADGYPVLIHSHGDRAFGGELAHVARVMASHGWVVVAPDHTDNLFPSGEDNALSHYIERPLDITHALDVIAALPADDPLSRAVTDRVILSGHSRGTYTTFASGGGTYDADALDEVCASDEALMCTPEERAVFAAGLGDPRVVGIIPMAGNIRRRYFGPEGHLSVDKPLLWITGSEDDRGVAGEWPSFASFAAVWIDLEGACHVSFTLGLCGTLDAEIAFAITQRYMLAFARRVLLGDTSEDVGALMSGETVMDGVTFLKTDTPL